jgi:hypothetical protein
MISGAEKHKFVFVGGLHRSGTTLLSDILGDHSDISGLTNTGVPMNEGQHLQTVFPPARTKWKLWPIRYLHPVAPDFLTTRGYGGPGRFAFDPGSHLTEKSKLATPENAQSIFESWAPFWDLSRPYLIEKSPPNLVRTRFLQALFPNTYFIILYRHPVPVSYATRRWTNIRPFHFLLEHWLVAFEQFERDRAHLQRVFTLRYEDFVMDPQAWLDRIYDFIGIERRPLQRSVSQAVNADYFDRWNKSFSSPVWRTYVQYMRARFERRFNRFGYTLGTPLLSGPGAGLLEPGSPAIEVRVGEQP